MAYFECIVGNGGGGSGAGADLIVTCNPVFAGLTITCTDGGSNTFTAQCPSTSPYEVTFESIPVGTYTISGTVSGQTFSTTKTITDFTATLGAIPDGSTVTPTDVIQTLLHCANIWDKSYTTISDLLSDTTSLLAVISDNNSADYLARSTTWATSVTADSTAMTYIGNNNYCADALLSDSTWRNAICNSTYYESVLNAKVPTMTSDTTPSGRVLSTDTVIDNKYKYYAFDNNDNTVFGTANSATFNIGYEFSSPVEILKFLIFQSFSSQTTVSILLQYSDDGSTWNTAGNSYSYTTGDKNTYNASKYGKHKYWRISATMASAKEDKVKTLQFYGRA